MMEKVKKLMETIIDAERSDSLGPIKKSKGELSFMVGGFCILIRPVGSSDYYLSIKDTKSTSADSLEIETYLFPETKTSISNLYATISRIAIEQKIDSYITPITNIINKHYE